MYGRVVVPLDLLPNIIGRTAIYLAVIRMIDECQSHRRWKYELDAREIDGEPFDDIVAALERLDVDETLVLINSFEPAPLYNVLERRGFTHETTQVTDDEWRVSITHA